MSTRALTKTTHKFAKMKATKKTTRRLLVDAPLLLLVFLGISPPAPGASFLKIKGCAQAQSGEVRFNEAKFSEMVEKVEADVLELARKVEELYQNRCEATLLADCYQGNYHNCMSSYPQETCPGGPDFDTPECGMDQSCSALYSFSVSSVSLPSGSVDFVSRNPTDPQIIETICFTKGLDDYFVQKRAEDEAFWSQIGFQPNFMSVTRHIFIVTFNARLRARRFYLVLTELTMLLSFPFPGTLGRIMEEYSA